MNCTWCRTEATQGGRLPVDARGKEYWPACAAHDYLIDKLHLDRMTPDELAVYVRGEKLKAKEAKAK